MEDEKEFYVDFESWTITADDSDEAFDKAMKMIQNGELPEIVGTEEV